MKAINKESSLYKIGTKVNIDLNLIKDRLPESLIDPLKRNSYGTIVAYKMTDGGGIGFFINLECGKNIWFFKEEIITLENQSNFSLSSKELKKEFKNIENQKSIVYVLNPINFGTWLMKAINEAF